MHKMIKVTTETHKRFKELCRKDGRMFDVFLNKIMDEHEAQAKIKELKKQGLI